MSGLCSADTEQIQWIPTWHWGRVTEVWACRQDGNGTGGGRKSQINHHPRAPGRSQVCRLYISKSLLVFLNLEAYFKMMLKFDAENNIINSFSLIDKSVVSHTFYYVVIPWVAICITPHPSVCPCGIHLLSVLCPPLTEKMENHTVFRLRGDVIPANDHPS